MARQGVERRLAAILSADVVGYSCLMGEDDVFDDEISYWVDVATVRGKDEGTDIEGWGFDVGATYTFDRQFTPYVTLSYAFGSGDSDPDSGDDEAFRQTGLQDNSDKYGGVTSFSYYGEVFDPVLTNLQVFTAGIGARPTKRSSIDLVFHYFRQDEFSDSLRSPLDLDPNEDATMMSKSLGSEIDLIIGARRILPGVNVELTVGYFMPGDAFRVMDSTGAFGQTDDAFFANFQASYRF